MTVQQPKETPKKRRGVVLYQTNPFMDGGAMIVKPKTKRITNKRGDMMVIGETGETVAPIAGFWQAKEVDSTEFVKLFVQGVKAFKDLTGAGTRVFELLYLEMQKNINKDRVFLSFHAVDQKTNPMSEATYTRGMKELTEKGFIAATQVQGWFWINPAYLWNGDRLAFVREFRRGSSASAYDPRQQSLELEG